MAYRARIADFRMCPENAPLGKQTQASDYFVRLFRFRNTLVICYSGNTACHSTQKKERLMAVYPPGLRLRHTREALGLTYRDVEKASYEIAVKRGTPEFSLHISRLADIENRNVVPTLHKLYSLSTILHLDPVEISAWYEAPFHQAFQDSADFPPPRTHLAEPFLPDPARHTTQNSSSPSQSTDLL